MHQKRLVRQSSLNSNTNIAFNLPQDSFRKAFAVCNTDALANSDRTATRIAGGASNTSIRLYALIGIGFGKLHGPSLMQASLNT
jgi:hypothetical protein